MEILRNNFTQFIFLAFFIFLSSSLPDYSVVLLLCYNHITPSFVLVFSLENKAFLFYSFHHEVMTE
jgi:hypothetical protein